VRCNAKYKTYVWVSAENMLFSNFRVIITFFLTYFYTNGVCALYEYNFLPHTKSRILTFFFAFTIVVSTGGASSSYKSYASDLRWTRSVTLGDEQRRGNFFVAVSSTKPIFGRARISLRRARVRLAPHGTTLETVLFNCRRSP